MEEKKTSVESGSETNQIEVEEKDKKPKIKYS
jgi:hypothetical protein